MQEARPSHNLNGEMTFHSRVTISERLIGIQNFRYALLLLLGMTLYAIVRNNKRT